MCERYSVQIVPAHIQIKFRVREKAKEQIRKMFTCYHLVCIVAFTETRSLAPRILKIREQRSLRLCRTEQIRHKQNK